MADGPHTLFINGVRLLHLRMKWRLSQEEVAKKANVPLTTYRRYEKGDVVYRQAHVDQREKIKFLAAFFKVELDSLLCAREQPQAVRPVGGDDQAETIFLVHHPVTRPDLFYGRDDVLRSLSAFWERPPLDNVALVGYRVAGKTSLLRQLLHLSSGEGLRPDQEALAWPPRQLLRLLLLDLQEPSMHTPEGLVRHLMEALGVPGSARPDLFPQQIGAALAEPTVVLLDHAEVLLRKGDANENLLWNGLRALQHNHTSGRLGFLIATQSDADLQRRWGRSSSFFSTLRTLHLGPLEETEARALAARSPLAFPQEDVDFILRESCCWPRVLHIGYAHLLEALQHGKPREAWRPPAQEEMRACLKAAGVPC